jgi:hypothetical protein
METLAGPRAAAGPVVLTPLESVLARIKSLDAGNARASVPIVAFKKIYAIERLLAETAPPASTLAVAARYILRHHDADALPRRRCVALTACAQADRSLRAGTGRGDW